MPQIDRNVKKEINRVFGEKAGAPLVDLLEKADFYTEQQMIIDRVAMAVLFGSKGKEDVFIKLLKLAALDYHDLFLQVKFSDGDWRSILKKAGYWAPPETI
jgi:hypothetical protein